MSTLTSNFNFVLPAVNSSTDQDLWGGQNNGNWSAIDAFLKTAMNDVTISLTGVTTIDATYQNNVILANATSASFVITLLPAATAGAGFKVTIKKTDSSANTVTIQANAAELIDLLNTQVLTVQDNSYTLVSDGTQWWIVGQIQALSLVKTVKRQVFTSSGTYTPSAGMLYADVEVIGAGGGGGGTTNSGTGGGGAAGGNAKKVISATTIGATQSVTIGTSGTGGANTGGTGGTGGTTSFGSIISATGGNGGVGNSSSASNSAIGGLGGIGSGGDINGNGAPGTQGNIYNSSVTITGTGGSSAYGGGGLGLASALTATAGNAATGHGAGGGGAMGASSTGGAGTAGLVIITEYCSQ